MENDAVAAILELPAGLDSVYEKIDKSIASMSKNLDNITKSLGKGGLKSVLDLKVDTSAIETQLNSLKGRIANIPTNEIVIPVKLNAKEAIDGLQQVSSLITEVNRNANVVMGIEAIKTAYDSILKAAKNQGSILEENSKKHKKSKEEVEAEAAAAERLRKRYSEINMLGKSETMRDVFVLNGTKNAAFFKQLAQLEQRVASVKEKVKEFSSALSSPNREFSETALVDFQKAHLALVQLHNNIMAVKAELAKPTTMTGLDIARFSGFGSSAKNVADNLRAELKSALNVPIDISSIDSINSALERTKEILSEMKAERKGKNPFVTEEDVRSAEAGIKSLTQSLKQLNEEKAKIDSNRRVDSIMAGIGLSYSRDELLTIDGLKTKLEGIKEAIRAVKAEGRYGDRSSFLAKLNKQAAETEKNLLVLQNAAQRVNSDAAALRSTFMYTFNIMGVIQFYKQMVKVRGEFEMIQKSLEVLVGDARLSKQIFDEIQNIAIKSPYEIKDLAKQTKQLAAYGIETDKLVEKTKMLGDIASGTGVDIQRLSLAYGQIRAAQFLKGTEARQLTEAGVDIYGALSRYYTELEGKMVSVNEILDRQRRKLITFQDVDTVLKGMTQLGGKFYQMQEKQAETVQGQISNIKDRASKMFNEIGTSYQGVIKGVINLMNWILSNSNAVSTVMVTWASFRTFQMLNIYLGKLPSKLQTASRSFRILRVELNKLEKTFPSLTKKINGMLLALAKSPAQIAAIGAAIVLVISLVVKLAKSYIEVRRIEKEHNAQLAVEIRQYSQLHKVLASDTASRKEKSKALSEMKSRYGEILPLQDIELDNVNKLTSAYQANIKALRDYIKQKQVQEQTEAILSNLSNNSGAEMVAKNITHSANKIIKEANKGVSEEVLDSLLLTDAEVAAVLGESLEKMIDGTIKTEQELIDDVVLKLRGLRESFSIDWGEGELKQRMDENPYLFNLYVDYKRAFNRINKLFEDNAVSDVITKEINAAKSEVQKAYDDYLSIMEEKGEDISKYTNNSFLQEKDAIEYASQVYEDVKAKFFEKFNAASAEGAAWATDSAARMFENALSGAMAKITPSNIDALWQSKLAEVNAQLNDTYGSIPFEIGKGAGTKRESGQTSTEYRKQLLDLAKKREDVIKSVKSSMDPFIWEEFLQEFSIGKQVIDAIREGITGPYSPEAIEAELRKRIIDLATGMNKATKEFAQTLTPETDSEIREKLKEYKSNVASFVRELMETVREWDNIDVISRQIQESILRNKAKKLNISLPEISSNIDFGEFVDNLFKGGKITKDNKLELDLIINNNKAKKALDELKDKADALWEEFEFIKNLEDMKIGFDGSSAIDTLNQIATLEAELRAKGYDDAIKAADEIKKKRLELLRKEREEALEIMSKSNKKAEEETIRATKEAYSDINKIIENANKGAGEDILDASGKKVGTTPTVSESSIQEAVKNRLANAYADVTKAQWEAYKGTQMYIAAFGDLDTLGTDVIKALRIELEKYAKSATDALSPTEIKQVQNQLISMDEELARRGGAKTFMGALVEGFRNIESVRRTYTEDVQRALNDWTATLEAANAAKEEQLRAQKELESATASYASAKSKYDQEGGESGASAETKAAYTSAQTEMAEASDRLVTAEKNVKKATDASDAAMENYNRTVKKLSTVMTGAKKRLNDIQESYGKVSDAISKTISFTEDMAEALGYAFDDDTVEVLQAFQDGFSLVGSAMGVLISMMEVYTVATTAATAATAALETLLWPLLLVAAALGGIMAALKATDNAIKNNIENHKKKLEGLQESYEKLEDYMEEALTLNEVGGTYEKQLKNLERQKQELKDIIALENSRKNPDEDAISDYEKDLRGLEDSAREVRDKVDEILGKPSDYQQLAKSWSSSWIEAFKETGDGLDALRQSFDEMYQDLIVGQLQNIVVGPAIEKLKGYVDMILSDLVITSEEADGLRILKEETMKQVNEGNKALMSLLGEQMDAAINTDTIQKGISSLSEETGIALESLANSMRAHLANIDSVLTSAFGASGEGEMENPFLRQLKAQTELTRDIKNLLSNVIKSGSHPSGGGFGIRVFTD